jgi:hypothetical protein
VRLQAGAFVSTPTGEAAGGEPVAAAVGTKIPAA